MNEQTYRDFLEDLFEGNFELLSFIKADTCSCDINFNCNISNQDKINRFADFYIKETNETVNSKQKKKRIFSVKATYRCLLY